MSTGAEGAGSSAGIATQAVEGAARALAKAGSEATRGRGVRRAASGIARTPRPESAPGAIQPPSIDTQPPLSPADRAANQDLAQRSDPPDAGAIDRLAGAPPPTASESSVPSTPSVTPDTSATGPAAAESAGAATSAPSAPEAQGVSPGDRAYDAVVAETDAKRALDAARANPGTDPAELQRLEQAYTKAATERTQAFADRDRALANAEVATLRTELDNLKAATPRLIQEALNNAMVAQTEALKTILDQQHKRIEETMTGSVDKWAAVLNEKDKERRKKMIDELKGWIKGALVGIAVQTVTSPIDEMKDGLQNSAVPQRR